MQFSRIFASLALAFSVANAAATPASTPNSTWRSRASAAATPASTRNSTFVSAAATPAPTPNNAGELLMVGEQVYGGIEMPRIERPWLVGIRAARASNSFCGGALIAPTWVLTAAHCGPNNARFVSIGSQFLRGERDGERIRVKRAIVHPQYVDPFEGNDFMLLELERASVYPPVAVIRSHESSQFGRPNAIATAMGWGATETADNSDQRLKVKLRVWDTAICERTIGFDIHDQSSLCAGGELNRDSCQGDSGGPLVQNIPGTFFDVLIGVVSFGGDCGVKGQPAVYGRVSSALDFIYRYAPGVRIFPPRPL